MTKVKSSFNIKGHGLMSAVPVELELKPSDNKGIRFHIADAVIEANVKNVVSTEHCVVLCDMNEIAKGNMNCPKVALVEHFMAACAIVGLDCLDVYFVNPNFEIAANMQNAFEMPILDGSAKEWVERFNEIGIEGDINSIKTLSAPISFEKNNTTIVAIPSENETKITYMVNYDHPDLKNRFFTLIQDENLNEIVEARTFGYLKDLEKLQEAGFSRGVTYENTVGLTDIAYTTDLRSEMEPVKHKILDIIGDLYLTGYNPLKMKANILVKEAGHHIHVEFAKKLLENLEENI